jgi:nitrate reductase NapD
MMDTPSDGVTRRQFLAGRTGGAHAAGSPSEEHCISSAVVAVLPGREDEIAARLAEMNGVELRARQGGKMVVLLEGPGSGAVGSLLLQIAIMDGVITANMVFEHVEQEVQGV